MDIRVRYFGRDGSNRFLFLVSIIRPDAVRRCLFCHDCQMPVGQYPARKVLEMV